MGQGAGGAGRPASTTLVHDLALSAPADVARFHEQRLTLLAAARTLVDAAAHDPDVAACDDARCRLTEVAAPHVCTSVHALALLHEGPVVRSSFALAWPAFRTALTDASEAVGACRRTAHPHGACWFRATGGDGCGALLRLAHELG